jgi:hypothetical protein
LCELAARANDTAQALQYFTTDLERGPEAEERALVEARIAQWQGGAP